MQLQAYLSKHIYIYRERVREIEDASIIKEQNVYLGKSGCGQVAVITVPLEKKHRYITIEERDGNASSV